MDKVNSVIQNFDMRFDALTGSYTKLQNRISELDLQLEQKNQELLKSLEETKRLQNLLDGVLQSIDDAVIAIGVDSKISMANRATYELLDAKNRKIEGKPYQSIFPTMAAAILPHLDSHPLMQGYFEEREIVTLSGERKIVESVVTSLLTNKGLVQVLKDITETVKLRQECKRAEIFSTLSQMARFFADEIRNPLGGIVGNVSLLKSKKHRKDKDQIISAIEMCVEKLSTLVSDIHLLSRPIKPQFKKTHFGDFVKDVSKNFFRNYKTMRYSVRIDPRTITVNIDPLLIQQALTSIFLNAVEAVTDSAKVSISLSRLKSEWGGAGNLALLVIEDNGCGVSREDQSKLFTPFFSTKPNGRGLGLAIARNFIRFHRGDIKIESVEGVGTKVLVYLNCE